MHFEITDLMVTVLPPHTQNAGEEVCPQHTTSPDEHIGDECPTQTVIDTKDCPDDVGIGDECPVVTLIDPTTVLCKGAASAHGAGARLEAHRQALRRRLAEAAPESAGGAAS